MAKTYLQRVKKALRKNTLNRYRDIYLKWYKKNRVLKDTVLMESTHGTDFYGHMLFIAKEILTNQKYEGKNVYIAVEKSKLNVVKDRLKHQGVSIDDPNLHFVLYLDDKYCELLARAEYLFNDTTFFDFFIKQSFQIYTNIWHGTPLKKLGKYTGSVRTMANVQKNFYSADYIVVSNDYTKEALIDSYNLAGVYRGKIIVAPSIRNSVLNNVIVRNAVRRRYNLKGKNAIVYMPTWRGSATGTVFENKQVIETVKYLDASLKENQIVFLKLHPFEAEQHQIDYSAFKHIKEFPTDCETYDFLAASDQLITDYSSVMYDYMNTKKPITLYVYDKEAYYASRGCYEDIEFYPFPKVRNKDQLLKSLLEENKAKYIDTEFQKKFVGLDQFNGAEELLEFLFERTSEKKLHLQSYEIYNHKETVIMCVGALWNNGITKALINTFDAIDTKKRNYVIFFARKNLSVLNEYILFNLPKGVTFYPVPGKILADLKERVLVRHYSKNEWFKFPGSKKIVDGVYRREYRRVFESLKPDHFIHYTGFERKYAEMISAVKGLPLKTSIFVHTDMNAERLNRGSSISWKMLTNAYNSADNVVLVSQQLRKDFEKTFPKTRGKIKIVNNFLGSKLIRENSKESLFTTLLGVPVTYANNTGFEQKFNKLLGHSYVSKNLPSVSQYRSIINKHYLKDSQNFEKLFPFITKHFDEFRTAIETKEKKYFSANNPLVYTMSEISGMYSKTALRVMESLFDPSVKVYVTIGRMAKQKRQDRIIEAFTQIHRINSKTRLIIIAPHGSLRKETINWIKNSTCSEAIFLLGSMSNPYGVLKASDAFLFSSEYEGLGLVVFEALALDKDVITTYLPETVEVLGEKTALVSKNDDQDFVNKAILYEKHGFEKEMFDFAGKDDQSIVEFESLFK
ncbi:CDP-glycerol glycerophosphotransferase family protein [Pediococcus ethanolidurans]|uniref:CDP-glycerol glycerophosphotransferase family protein n=1 Tax=Pediococcus ethanolidurans TaxID=319653 RepID=UPI001C1EE6FB|nr:CDP-glycerol glycerophosphotransferase family protein [Pediococcus ethanolidurans]MBU7554201.1 CDP-glycerol glycerophosphotransferase family protein [Pediococcus ethanolidurans]MCV3324455.1 CDP-glycerol glycerophosphotransferase family protein [Pediococcus ethanolidurans]